MKRIRFIANLIITFLICIFIANLISVQALAAPAPKPVVIVIDPGHGGDSIGAEYFGTQEKDITLVVSNAIKDYLEKFDNVTVYLTRTDDSNPTYTRRAQFAKDKNANVFISIHFNESEKANRTGFEIWVPTDPKLQRNVMPLATTMCQNANSHICFSEGIFNITNNDGEDYYGQLRRAFQNNLNAIIVQELYMDRPENKAIIHSPEALKEIGKQNAIAIAQAYRLSSESLGLDFSSLQETKYKNPLLLTEETFVYPGDVELSMDSFEQTSDERCNAAFTVKSVDHEKIFGYRYSLDRGKTYSGYTKIEADSSFTVNLNVKPGEEPILRVIAYNEQGLSVTSNEIELGVMIKLDPEFTKKKNEEAFQQAQIRQQAIEEAQDEAEDYKGVFENEARFTPTKSIVIVFGAAAGLAICVILLIGSIRPKKKVKE